MTVLDVLVLDRTVDAAAARPAGHAILEAFAVAVLAFRPTASTAFAVDDELLVAELNENWLEDIRPDFRGVVHYEVSLLFVVFVIQTADALAFESARLPLDETRTVESEAAGLGAGASKGGRVRETLVEDNGRGGLDGFLFLWRTCLLHQNSLQMRHWNQGPDHKSFGGGVSRLD